MMSLNLLNHCNSLIEEMPLILDTAIDNFYQEFEGESTFGKLTSVFNTLRETLYLNQLLQYLQATYEAALEGSFQNFFVYPSLFKINQYLLYEVLTNICTDNQCTLKK